MPTSLPHSHPSASIRLPRILKILAVWRERGQGSIWKHVDGLANTVSEYRPVSQLLFGAMTDCGIDTDYCPSVCTCTKMGPRLPLPPPDNRNGCPNANADSTFGGLCAFNCNRGYCKFFDLPEFLLETLETLKDSQLITRNIQAAQRIAKQYR